MGVIVAELNYKNSECNNSIRVTLVKQQLLSFQNPMVILKHSKTWTQDEQR